MRGAHDGPAERAPLNKLAPQYDDRPASVSSFLGCWL